MSWISLVIAIVSAIFTWVQTSDRRRAERQVHISRVSVSVEEQRQEIQDYSWSSAGEWIVVRNDGPTAVTVASVALAYGQRRFLGDHRPVRWEFDAVPPGRIPTGPLGPGESWKVPAPEGQSSKSILGPVCQVTDVNGRVWQRVTWGFRQLHDGSRPWPPLGLWFDRHVQASGEDEGHILLRIDRWMYRRSKTKARHHLRSRRLPWQLHFLNATWGYKVGRNDTEQLPWDAPRSWQYPHLWFADDDSLIEYHVLAHHEEPAGGWRLECVEHPGVGGYVDDLADAERQMSEVISSDCGVYPEEFTVTITER